MRKPTSQFIGLRELREHMEVFINAVREGRSFIVLRKSKPVFKLVPVDEWGDDGVWETVIDFRELDRQGAPAEEVLHALEHMKEHDR